MLHPPYFIDFQGGRHGALQYDIASLLYDGKAALSPEIRIELLDYYISKLKNFVHFDEEEFRKMFCAFAYVRIMQACGSYGYRGFFENKPHFLNSIPPAMRNLKYLVENHKLPIEIPHLENCWKQLTENEDLLNYNSGKNQLTVTVMSFSYRKGIPYDPVAREDPDVTLPAEEREIGGLGIFMTKKAMDDVIYEYKDGQNVLTLKKYLRKEGV